MNSNTVTVTIPGDACYLKAMRAFFKSFLGDIFGAETEMLVLALDECCSNVLKYGADIEREGSARAPGALCVSAELYDSFVRFRVGDFCHKSDIPSIQPRDLEEVRPGGLGTHFLKRIMDRVEFDPEPDKEGRMALVLEKKRPGQG